MLIQTFTQVNSYDQKVLLADQQTTTVHVARYSKTAIRPHLVIFNHETSLLNWCREHRAREAISGGYFWRPTGNMLGETWLDGQRIKAEDYAQGWAGKRGSLYLPSEGPLVIGPRQSLPAKPTGDLLEVGPTLVHKGLPTYAFGDDPEGFAETAVQHDEFIDNRRHPRAAIATSDEYVWTVTVDGRCADDAGMYLTELADFLVSLGATEAINLDGGRSASHISNGQLINVPRSDHETSRTGFPIRNAIIIA